MSTPQPRPDPLLVLLEDAAAGAGLLELSTTLAHAMQRDLGVVYVENSRLLLAAALPFARVLPFSATRWVPLSEQDVEQGFRAQAARLRGLTERAALQRRLAWSLRVVRGSLVEAAATLQGESDLLLLAGGRGGAAPAAGGAARRRARVAVACGEGAAAGRVREVAGRLAQALSATLETETESDQTALLGDARSAARAGAPQPDVLVLSRQVLSPDRLALARCPVLLVG